MAVMQRGDLSIYYETRGKGFPLLLIAPGGMTSVISFWARSAFNPIEIFSQDYWTIAMEQRNAGKSSGPLDMDDPWGSYADDQLELMNCLGVEKFFVLGCCIGCCFALKLIERAPDRVVAAVLEQPVGQDEANKDVLAENLYRRWLEGMAEKHPDTFKFYPDKRTPMDVLPCPVAYGLKKGDTKWEETVSAFIRKKKESGELQALFDKYMTAKFITEE